MAPVAMTKVFRNPPPRIASVGRGVHITHIEQLVPIPGSITFALSKFDVNPGLSGSFPWLSSIARRYEKYRITRLEYHYNAKCATTAAGNVILAPEFGIEDDAPVTSYQMSSYKSAVNTVPWRDIVLRVKNTDMQNYKLYKVRSTPVTDATLYDPLTFYIATEGQADTSQIGLLYVSYDIEFVEPQLSASAGNIAGGDLFSVTGIPASLGYGGTFDPQSRDVTVAADGMITLLQRGTYVFVIDVQCSDVPSAPSFNVGAGVTFTGYAQTVQGNDMTYVAVVVNQVANGNIVPNCTVAGGGTVDATHILVSMLPDGSA